MTLNAYASAYLMAIGTAPSEEVAKQIVRALVERRLIACGTVLPGAVSIYRWNAAIEEAPQVPELIVVPITGGHKPYLDLLSAET